MLKSTNDLEYIQQEDEKKKKKTRINKKKNVPKCVTEVLKVSDRQPDLQKRHNVKINSLDLENTSKEENESWISAGLLFCHLQRLTFDQQKLSLPSKLMRTALTVVHEENPSSTSLSHFSSEAPYALFRPLMVMNNRFKAAAKSRNIFFFFLKKTSCI